MTDRQSIVTLSVKGPYTGKPRPWLVIQSDMFSNTDSVTACLLTGDLVRGAPWLRIDVEPSPQNGLRRPGQVQIDKIATVPRSKIDRRIGRLEDGVMRQVEEAVRFFLDLRP